MKIKHFILPLLMFLGACTGTPDGIKPVKNFNVDRYLGTWYEIARLDHRFEDGLSNVTAEYSRNADGTIKVINKGYSKEDNEWDMAEGKAKFVESSDIGHLKVSFFGPFYGSYVVFELDQDNYDYAFISGPNKSYLWLLARSPSPDQSVIDRFVSESKKYGFDTDALIFVDHNMNVNADQP